MSLTHKQLMSVMAYADGQVDADELPEVLALLAKSEQARQVLAQHVAMGDWVRDFADASAAASADKIADAVLHEVDKLAGGKVVGLERERARLGLRRQRFKEFGALGALAAIAAAIWLLPSKTAPLAVAPSQAPPSGSPVAGPSDPKPALPVAVASAEAPEIEPAGVDVQSVESPSRPFSIFYVPAANGVNAHASSVVVWIAE